MAPLTDEQLLVGYLSPYTGKTRRSHWRVMLDWEGVLMQAQVGLLDATRQHIEAWSASELRRGLAKGTVAARLSVVCGFYRWAHQEGHIGHDPAVYVRRPSRPRRSNQRWLEGPQLVALLDGARDVDATAHLLVCLLALNGLRLEETLAARVEHLDVQGDLTTLHLPSRKGGASDRVSLPARTVDALTSVADGRDRGLLLRTTTGRRFTPSAVYALLDQITDAVDLPKVRPHMLRATFVTLSLDAGVPIRDVMASTGHAHSSMVDYYDRGYASVRRNAAHRLSESLGLGGTLAN